MTITSIAETADAEAGTFRERRGGDRRPAVQRIFDRFAALPWTASYLAFVLPLTAEDVLRSGVSGPGSDALLRREWRWISLAQRLTWLYGPDEALRRLNGLPVTPAPEARAA